MATRVGVILSGCGYLDGTEVHESVLTLLFLDRAGAQVRCFAPDAAQQAVVDHRDGESVAESRNVLVESARIARGEVEPLSRARAEDLDAVIMPGGYGAAQNLSDFALRGAQARAEPDLARLLSQMHAAGKPIGAICIAPAVVAAALGASHPTLTIGSDAGTAAALEALGARHRVCGVEGHVVDAENRIVSTPAYMLGPGIRHVAAGIERLVADVLAMARAPSVA